MIEQRPGRPGRVTIEVPAWVAALTDRGVQAGVVLVACAAAGFVVLGLGWAGVAARLYVALQLPFLVSGAFGGVALVGVCLGLLAVHLERRASASDRHEVDAAIRAAGALAETLPAYLARRRPRDRALVVNNATVHLPDCRMAAGRDLPRLSGFESRDGLRPCGICRPIVREGG